MVLRIHQNICLFAKLLKNINLIFFTILEMGRDNFVALFLSNLSGGQDIQWYCVPPMGRSGCVKF
jgi:hypothetical protein